MKKRRLKKWVKVVLNGIAITLCIVIIGFLVNEDKKRADAFISNCESLGYTTNYCIAHS